MSTLNIDNIANVAGTGAPDFAAMPSVAGDLVVASGSNSDGFWIKFADRTMICRKASSLLSGDGTIQYSQWMFPAVFTAVPTANVTWQIVSNYYDGITFQGLDINYVTFLFNPASGITGVAHGIAIGHWK